MQVTMKNFTAADSARSVRLELKQVFPATKFSIRSETFSGGDAVRVSWENGPTAEAIDKVVNKYQEGSFDGMTDSYNYDNRIAYLPQVKYVQTTREISNDICEATKLEIAKDYGIKDVNDEKEWHSMFRMWSSQRVWMELKDKSF